MKKLFIAIATVALVATASCTKVTPDESSSAINNKISFNVANYSPTTKADSHGHTSFIDELAELGIAKANAAFSTEAFVHADNGNGTVAVPVDFFVAGTNNVEAVKYVDGDTKYWEPEHTYYWPKAKNSSVSFFSWYDFNTSSSPALTYTTDGGTATLAWTNRTVALKDNVMWADAAYHYKKNPTAIHGLDGVTEGVPTLFHHALAKVRFTAKASQLQKEDTKNAGYYTFWEVKLSEVSIPANVVKNNGNLTLTQTGLTTNGTKAWTVPSPAIWAAPATQTYSAKLDENNVFNNDVAKGTTALTTEAQYITAKKTETAGYMANNYFTVLPQAVADGIVLTFKYTVTTKYGQTLASAETVSTETINVNDLAADGTAFTANGIKLNAMATGTTPANIANWEMNHCYTYNIIINPETDTIKFDPAVEAWAAEESASITVHAE